MYNTEEIEKIIQLLTNTNQKIATQIKYELNKTIKDRKTIEAEPHQTKKIHALTKIIDIYKTKQNKITTPEDAAKIAKSIAYEPIETIIVIHINQNYEYINKHIITKGTTNEVSYYPKEIFRRAIETNAPKIIVAHNHPSNNTEPSEWDIKIGKETQIAGKILGIKVIDQLIITKDSYYSFTENKLLIEDTKKRYQND